MKTLITCLIFLMAFPIQAQEEFLDKGFEFIKENESLEALNVWFKGSSLDGTKELEAQANQLDQVKTYFGEYRSHEYISEKAIGKNNKIVYGMLNLDTGSFFMRFLLYKRSTGDWIMTNFNFDVKPENVWPQIMIVE